MPWKMRKVKGGYRVSHGSHASAKKTTKARAKAQIRLLYGLENGWHPTRKRK
jgi:hypothetical protein